jgi:hypothetical protein
MSAIIFTENDVRFIFTHVCYAEGWCFIDVLLYLFTYTGVQPMSDDVRVV